MEQRFFATLPPAGQLVFTLLIILVSFFLVSLISILFGILIFGIPMQDWISLADLNDPAETGILKYLQITQALGIFVIPPLVVGFLAQRNPLHYLTLHRHIRWRPLFLVILILGAGLPVINMLAIWNEGLNLPRFLNGIESWMGQTEEQAARLTELFLRADRFSIYLVNLFMVAIIPAFGEEFLFRGVLQRIFTKWFMNPHLAILLASILFSALHLQFYGFLPRMALGLLFGYLFYWSGKLWYPVIAHFVNNFIPVTLVYLYGNQLSIEEMGTIGSGQQPLLWAIPSLFILLLLLYWFKKLHHQNLTKTENPSP